MDIRIDEILKAREARVERQCKLLQEHRCPVVCFTMNIAGPVKTSPLIRRAFLAGLSALENALPEDAIRYRGIIRAQTGDEAIFSVAMEAGDLKAICTAIEEAAPMGRLFDMDVLDENGRKLSRAQERCCLVCGKPGRDCAARRTHSVEALQQATRALIREHFAEDDQVRIADTAVTALMDEVHTTPKPGLVDRRNNGSHRDMDTALFTASAYALRPYFLRCAAIGQQTAPLPAAEVFPLLRQAGLEAEKTMYAATGGVNTHKGAIYTLGILCAAASRLHYTAHTGLTADDILAQCAAIAADAAREDLQNADDSTAGLRLYQELGLTGIRGEMAAGLPSVKNIALPALEAALARGLSRNDAGAVALLHLIANVRDTNLYHRGGQTGAVFAALSAQELLERSPYPTAEQIEALDDAFIAQGLSPGGCADLLAATYFLKELL